MKTLRAMSVLLVFVAFAVTLVEAQSAPPASTADASQALSASNTRKIGAVRTVLVLKTTLTSKNAPVGKPIKALLKQPLTLPDGEVLPKDTSFLGSVLASNKHSKEKPNGTLILDFHEAVLKGHDPIQLIVRIKALAAPAEGDDDSVTLPNSNGGMVALASNSGGGAQMNYQSNDHGNLAGKQVEASSIEGVHILPSAQGAGAIFALGEDFYLDAGVQMTVLVAVLPPKVP